MCLKAKLGIEGHWYSLLNIFFRTTHSWFHRQSTFNSMDLETGSYLEKSSSSMKFYCYDLWEPFNFNSLFTNCCAYLDKDMVGFLSVSLFASWIVSEKFYKSHIMDIAATWPLLLQETIQHIIFKSFILDRHVSHCQVFKTEVPWQHYSSILLPLLLIYFLQFWWLPSL